MQPRVERDGSGDSGSRPIRAKSNLPLNYNLAGTYRFGELGVCFVQDTVPDDETPFGSSHDLRSMNMRAPLMSDLDIKKDYIEVPLPALLPLNYEKFITQPQIGEDVDPRQIGLNVNDFTSELPEAIFTSDWVSLSDLSGESLSTLVKFFDQHFAIQAIYSNGALPAFLGLNFGPLYKDCDKDFDTICSIFLAFLKQLEDSEAAAGYKLGFPIVLGKDLDDKYIWRAVTTENFRDFLVWARDNHFESSDLLFVEGGDWFDEASLIYDFVGQVVFDLQASFVDEAGNETGTFEKVSSIKKPISLARPFAYQLACAEFFTNSHVDDVYSAQLFRQNYSSFLHDSDTGLGLDFDTFELNGVRYQYDDFSSHYTLKVIRNMDMKQFREWTILVFGFRRSLRYQDYFTSSRTRPLAVGDVNVQVNDGYVNIVDTIEKRWYAKFLNQVNRFQRKLSDYSRALFPGLTMQRDFHNPLWLAGTSDKVGAPETENTSEAQLTEANSTTSVLRSSSGGYHFEYHSQYYGVIIGLEWFDIKRYYAGVIERPNFWVDRNDYFNPFLQFIGDQPIYQDELYAGAPHEAYLGYTGRYAEYKYRVDQAVGGFVQNLPGWTFLADDKVLSRRFRSEFRQSSDFIRSWTTELDDFFPALSGYSLGSYFHFIVVNSNRANNTRDMVANPQLD